MPTSSPTKLGRYEVIEEVGKGAMGVVYLARDPLIGRLVALKTFRVGFTEKDQELQQFRNRFVREAQSAGILSHPNIVTIHDVVDDGDICFIAMEYVKGTNLKLLLQRPDPLPLDYVVNIVAQIAEGLDYAHSRGVVHRDVKPANILITSEDKVKITDFGIARLESSNLTLEGQLLGTPNYMAPEQIQGKEIDHRADIFSLGVVLYEMVTRKKPFHGENLTQVTHRIVYEPFTPPEEIVAGLPDELTLVLGRSLEKDPSRRYQRASQVAEDLRKLVAAGKGKVGPAPEEIEEDETSATQEVQPVSDETAGKPHPIATEGPTVIIRGGFPAAASSATPPAAAASADAGAGAPPPPSPPSVTVPGAPSSPMVPGALAPMEAQGVAPPKSAPAVSAPIAKPPAAASRPNWILWAAVGVGVLAVIGIAVVVIARRSSTPAAPTVTSLAEMNRDHIQEAIIEARTYLVQGNLALAESAVTRAEQLGGQGPDIDAIHSDLRKRREEQQAVADTSRQITELIAKGHEAVTDKRYDDAISAAAQVLSISPGNAEAAQLKSDAEAAKGSLKAKPRPARSAPASSPAAATPASTPATSASSSATPAATAASADASLAIDFFSASSEGVLTIYAGDRQILRESFKFVRKTGFLRSEKTTGTIQARRTLPAGHATLRVYISLPGKPTKAISVEADFTGGATRTLIIRVDESGAAAAGMNK